MSAPLTAGGNSDRATLYRHVLRNAMGPVVSFLAMTVADIVAGSVVIEQVFSLPGLGRMLLTSIANRDYPVVQAVVVIVAFWVVLVNLLADLINQRLDPDCGCNRGEGPTLLLNEKKNHYLRAGLVLTGLMAALALLGCVWTPYPPTAMSGSEKFAAPCLRHLFGTDNFGRDIFSRVLAGAGTTFFISAATVVIGAAVGTLVGGLHRLLRRLAGRGADARQRRGDGVPQHPAGAGVHLCCWASASTTSFWRWASPLCPAMPGHPQRVCPAPGDELCQKRPAHGSGAPAHYVSAYSAQHPAGAPADAGDRV